MYSHKLSSGQKRILTACRALNVVAAAFSLAIFAIVLRQRTSGSPDGASRSTVLNYLPVIACTYSIIINIINATAHWNRSLYIFPRPFHLAAEFTAVLLLVIFGYLGFVYDVITYWKTGLDSRAQQHVELLGIIILSIAHLIHVAFFLNGWKTPVREEQKRPLSAPPTYTRNAMTAFEDVAYEEDAKSMRSLPDYQAFSYCSRDSLEKEKVPATRTEQV